MNETSVLDGVFDRFLENACIFRDREILRHDYIPKYLPHREEQIRLIGEIVAPVLKGVRSSNVLIYGKTGTGKTAVVKYVLNRLHQRALECTSPVRFCYVNCRWVGTEYRVLSALCHALGVQVPFTGLALGEVFDRFRKGLDTHNGVFIAVLDEIDALVKTRGDTILYELTRVNETLSTGKTSIIGISNDLRFKDLLDPRVLSSLSEEETVFRPYDAAELRDILFDRAKLAFLGGVLSDSAVGLCAALAAAEHGDARRALDLLRVAGELAEREGSKDITEEHIRRAETRIEHDRVVEALKNLPAHPKLVLFGVYLLVKTNLTRAITGEIYEIYCELCEQTGLTPLTQRRVSGLINELDVIGLLNTQLISMGRYGRTKKIRLGVTRGIISSVFVNDERLGHLIKYRPKCLTGISGGRH
ncbi:MAG: ORC1-type DNA replication protein [Candidatus Bathyarchaeota archaeon]